MLFRSLLQENARLLIDNIVRTESEIRAYIANISENDLSLSGKQRHEAMRSSLDKLFAISRICKRMIILFEDKDRQRTWLSPKQRLNLQNLFREVSISLSILNANLAGEYHKAGLTEALEQESRINTLRDTLLKKIPGGVEKGKFSSQSAEFYKEFISFSEKIADLAMETNQLIASCRNDQ